jgi:hypothetical protein
MAPTRRAAIRQTGRRPTRTGRGTAAGDTRGRRRIAPRVAGGGGRRPITIYNQPRLAQAASRTHASRACRVACELAADGVGAACARDAAIRAPSLCMRGVLVLSRWPLLARGLPRAPRVGTPLMHVMQGDSGLGRRAEACAVHYSFCESLRHRVSAVPSKLDQVGGPVRRGSH